MALISGAVVFQTVVTVVADSGNGAAIAAKFNGIVIGGVSPVAAVATNASGTVTITWAQSTAIASDELALNVVTNMLATDLTLTAPITITAGTRTVLAA